MNWYTIENIEHIDTPCLVLYKERMSMNIGRAVDMVRTPGNLRPHVKTNKIPEVCKMMMDAGITKFKCATIAEAEMLAMISAEDVLLAYQPVGPKIERLCRLALHYPDTTFSCLVDDADAAKNISELFSRAQISINVFIDINNGMNRTGIAPEGVKNLFETLRSLRGINIVGLHVYDGHIKDVDPGDRKAAADAAFSPVMKLANELRKKLDRKLVIVAGGSPTFPVHAKNDVECSPGTFVFWDWGYKHMFPDQPFEYAALVVCRIISVVDETTVTTDLGHKAIAAENPLPRVYFLNAPGSIPVAQSEEHLVLKVPEESIYKVGDVLYGVPVHICPTVALYEKAILVENHQGSTIWKVRARDRVINF
jgi:D-serine deaminase-like pyridoxal phosphate-dependent protein